MSNSEGELIQALIQAGKITQDDVDAVQVRYSNAFRRLVGNVHTLECRAPHKTEDKEDCQYYSEEQLDTCWDCISHRYWSHQVAKLMKRFGVKDPSVASVCLNKAGKMAESLQGMQIGPSLLTLYFIDSLLSQRPETPQGFQVVDLPLLAGADES